MSFVKETVSIAGAAGASAGTLISRRGRIDTIIYEEDGSAPYDNAATLDVSILREIGTKESVLSGALLATDGIWRPRVFGNTTAGAAHTIAPEAPAICDEQVEIEVTGGLANTTGKFTVIIET